MWLHSVQADQVSTRLWHTVGWQAGRRRNERWLSIQTNVVPNDMKFQKLDLPGLLTKWTYLDQGELYQVLKGRAPVKNSKWVWSGNTTITNRRQPHGTKRKNHSTTTRHQKDKLSKATSSLFPIKMIASLSWNRHIYQTVKKTNIVLTYGVPYKREFAHKLEMVQKRAARYTSLADLYHSTSSVTSMLDHLDLEPNTGLS